MVMEFSQLVSSGRFLSKSKGFGFSFSQWRGWSPDGSAHTACSADSNWNWQYLTKRRSLGAWHRSPICSAVCISCSGQELVEPHVVCLEMKRGTWTHTAPHNFSS